MEAAISPLSRYRWVILAVVFIAQTSNALAGQALAPLAPIFQPDLGLTTAEVGLFSSATYVGAWAVLLVAGSLTDRYGVRRMMSLGLLITGLTLVLMAWVGNVGQAVAVMLVAGLGRGAVLPGCTKGIVDWFPADRRATALGLKQAGVPMAGILTASTLPLIGLAVGWRYSIALVGILITAGAAAAAYLYRDSPVQGARASSRQSLRGGMGLVVRNGRLWALGAIAILFVVVQSSINTYLALYLKESGLSSLVPDENARIVAAGGFLAICQAGGVFGRVFWGVVSDRVFAGKRTVVLAIVGALTTCLLAVVWREAELASPWALGAVAFLLGTTAIGWNGLYHALVAESIGGKHAATGIGLSLSLTQMGVVGGPPLFGLMVDHLGSFSSAWGILTLVSAAGSLAALMNVSREKKVA